jgi:2'-5' RNA ligase
MTETSPPPDAASKTLRLFIAIELPPDVRAALAAAMLQIQQRGDSSALRWVRPEGVHLTLKFLGAVPHQRVELINTALRIAVRDAAPLTLQPDGFGAFHGGRLAAGRTEFRMRRESYSHNIRVLWIGLGGDTGALSALAARVENAIAPLGFPTEKRPYFPHLTLGRARETSTREQREQLWNAVEPLLSKSSRTGNFDSSLVPEFPAFTVGHVSLMHSTLKPGGAEYRALARFPLQGG